MAESAKRVALSTMILIAIVATVRALWKLKLVLALIFLAFILAAAMRPGIDRLGRAGLPRVVPLVAVLVTLVDVVIRDKDPAEEDVPAVLFPAKEAEN